MTKSTCTVTPKKKARKAKSRRNAGAGVPLEEMSRLMRVYGSIKSLRKRQKEGPNGLVTMKADSLKRKFYRWFPDLDERFAKDENGFYRPRAGHEFEMRYREDMRTRDGQTLVRKRATRRRERLGLGETETRAMGEEAVSVIGAFPDSKPHTSWILGDSAVVLPVSSDEAAPESVHHKGDTDREEASAELQLDIDRMASGHIAADIEPVDCAFVAEEGIFDDVERTFYGTTAAGRDCPSIASTSCSSSSGSAEGHSSGESSLCGDESPPAKSRSVLAPVVFCPVPDVQVSEAGVGCGAIPFVHDMLDKSIEECCDEVLCGGGDDGSVSGYLFDMISS